ncbi:MAG: hypothetical protein GY765_33005 [bacterium]|nr:hypothetical protein [bacterium]
MEPGITPVPTDAAGLSRPCLYYAMGGGLGHLARTFAILSAAPEIACRTRILASSDLTPLAAPVSPCPIDTVPADRLNSRSGYREFLDAYISEHSFQMIILDTFPWGIAGEWADTAPELPRFLVARRLKWDNYVERVRNRTGPFPAEVLLIEPPESDYNDILLNHCRPSRMDAPITAPVTARETAALSPNAQCKKRWLVLHSGPDSERRRLIRFAQKKRSALGEDSMPIDTVFPEDHVFPAESLALSYHCVVTGGGYNSAAAALTAPPEQRRILFPFERKFDDQFARVRALEAGGWLPQKTHGAAKAAKWLMENPTSQSILRL